MPRAATHAKTVRSRSTMMAVVMPARRSDSAMSADLRVVSKA
jgi:hypothetical protein